MAYITDGRLVKNFSLAEMTNTLSVEDIKLVITPEVVRQAHMMQELRDWYGKPMNVNSWYRTKSFNESVNGSKSSCHLDGIATDIALPNLSSEQIKLFTEVWRAICLFYGVIGGVSYYSWGIHFDSNNDPNRYGNYNPNFRVSDFR